MRERPGDAGFTLIEMMVVIAIMGFLLLLLVGRGPMRSTAVTLRASGQDVASDLRYERGLAIAAGRPVVFLIDPAAASYGAVGDMHALRPGIGIAALVKPEGPIVLQPDGSASAAAIRLTLGRDSEDVTLDWLTGRITIGAVQAAPH